MNNKNKRNFIIFDRHQRLTRLWQSLFTGWGLVMVASLVAGALFTKQILWAPISAVNMFDMETNQFKMTNAAFYGTDKKGEPFTITAKSGIQKYNSPDIVYLDTINGSMVRYSNNNRIVDTISARHGEYNRTKKNVKLTGNVTINSSNGDNLKTNELVIKL